MSAPFPNLYTHRKVAEAASKACDICYKQSTSVLITEDKKDFFYVCPIHLKDRHFCLPKIDEAALAAKREKELNEEKERLKKEYEEKQRKKKEKEEKKGEKDKDAEKDEKKDNKAQGNEDKKEEEKEDQPEEESRIFELKLTFYNARLQKRRQMEAAKRDRERVKKPGYFPSVPTDDPSK